MPLIGLMSLTIVVRYLIIVMGNISVRFIQSNLAVSLYIYMYMHMLCHWPPNKLKTIPSL